MIGTSVGEIRKKVERRWKSGEILRALVGLENSFPLRLSLTVPSARDMALELGEAQEWIRALRELRGVRLECRSTRSLTLGQQEIPTALWVDRAEDAVAFLEVQSDAECFCTLHATTAASFPDGLSWLLANPFRALTLRAEWDRILRVSQWMKTRSPQKMYLRQLDLPGVDSKFMERHLGVLAELCALPSSAETPVDGMDFHARFSFLREPLRVRFRILDPAIRFASLPGQPDVELDAESFAALQLPLQRVFVTENKTNFLAFPEVRKSIVVFGAGYGMSAFEAAQWVLRLPLYYWGDIDTHGFAILSQLRSVFPHARSFLMDRETLFAHRDSWTTETAGVQYLPKFLTEEETTLFLQMQAGIPEAGIRLEQEKVSFSCLKGMLDLLLSEEARVGPPTG
ncbi:MAG TPA: Wadjet anti-phage system protein JetD domain-containing protein [Acidobacteriaceae bacterium]|jgi:hypothetical protein